MKCTAAGIENHASAWTCIDLRQETCRRVQCTEEPTFDGCLVRGHILPNGDAECVGTSRSARELSLGIG